MYLDIYLGSFYSIKFLYDFFKTFLKSVIPPYPSSPTLPPFNSSCLVVPFLLITYHLPLCWPLYVFQMKHTYLRVSGSHPYMRKHVAFDFLHLSYVTHNDGLQLHLLSKNFIFPNTWIVCHCINIPHFHVHSSDDGYLGCLHVLVIVNNPSMNMDDPISLWWAPESFGYVIGSVLNLAL